MNSVSIPTMEPDRQYYFMNQCKTLVLEKKAALNRPLTYNIQTFGCQMNARDSEKILGILQMIGYEETDQEEADLVLYNTCTVRENANLKVYGHLGQLKRYKKQNPEMLTLLCGCMMQEKNVVDKIKTSYRNVDIIFGTHNIFKFAELLAMRVFDTSAKKRMIVDVWKDTDAIVEELPIERKYSFKSGVNIMFGCNNFCSYCIVPYVRGRERSREPEEIIKEIKELVADGVVEIMLLGQNVNSYGKNLEHPITFAELLRRVCTIEKIQRVRFMTSHPKDLSDELIDVIADNPKVCRHLHLPVQSGSTKILNAMNRRYTKESYLALVDRIRTKVPEISLTTDIIVGFPGETEEDFLETMDVVEKVQYDTAFTFIYSKRTGTPAAGMENGSTKEEIQDRYNRLLRRVQEISDVKTLAIKGQTQPVLVEGFDEKGDGLLTGRLSNNILVHFPGCAEMVGKILNVKLVECKGFYYMGELAE